MEDSNSKKGDFAPEREAEELLKARVSQAITRAGGASVVSVKARIPKGTLEKYVAKTSTPSLVRASRIARALDLSLDDFLPHAPNMVERRASDASHMEGMAMLPFYEDVLASAGPGALAVSESNHGVIALAHELLRDLGANPERCAVIRSRGDSMSPTIPDGSLLVVDRDQIGIANGCITVIGVGDDLLVKRVRRRTDGRIDLISDNSAYQTETLGAAELESLRVIGRVIYFCRVP